jgi:hypothetical protein
MELLRVIFQIKNKEPQFRFPNWGYDYDYYSIFVKPKTKFIVVSIFSMHEVKATVAFSKRLLRICTTLFF